MCSRSRERDNELQKSKVVLHIYVACWALLAWTLSPSCLYKVYVVHQLTPFKRQPGLLEPQFIYTKHIHTSLHSIIYSYIHTHKCIYIYNSIFLRELSLSVLRRRSLAGRLRQRFFLCRIVWQWRNICCTDRFLRRC